MSDPKLEEIARKCGVNLGLWGDPHFDADVATILAALSEAAEAAVRQEREASQHGPVQQRCACPGCEARIPACWASVLCRDCLAEDCDHDARSRPEEPKPE